MIKHLTRLIISIFLISCQDKAPSQKEANRVNYQSEIKYTYDSSIDVSKAAIIMGTPIEWAQINSADVALQELEERYNKQAVLYAQNWAKKLLEKESLESIDLSIFVNPITDKLKEILAATTKDSSINIKYEVKDKKLLAQTSNGKKLSWDSFHADNSSYSQLYSKLFNQRMQRLNGIVIRRLLLMAAKKNSQPIEAYIQKNILDQEKVVAEQEVTSFAEQNNISQSQLDDKMKKRIADVIRQKHRDQTIESYVAKNLAKEPIKISFQEPKFKLDIPQFNFEAPQWGNPQAAKILFIGNWSCRSCPDKLSHFLELKQKFLRQLNGQFLFGFSENERKVRMGAEAALCVNEQKSEFFWGFLAKIVNREKNLNESVINQAAKEQNLDYQKFHQCFLSRKYQDTVTKHLEVSKKIGISQFPVVTFNGEQLQSISEKSLAASVEGLIEQNTKKLSLWSKILTFFGFSKNKLNK